MSKKVDPRIEKSLDTSPDAIFSSRSRLLFCYL